MQLSKPSSLLVACEVSGECVRAFRAAGVDAWSVDLGIAAHRYHYCGDALEVLRSRSWDAVIAFPPCTHLAVSGSRHFPEKIADGRQQLAIDFFSSFIDSAPFWAIENPVGVMSTKFRRPDQVITPSDFGHDYSKRTCLWLGGFPPLTATKSIVPRFVNGRPRWANQTDAGQCRMSPGPLRAARRSKTFRGIAQAMADQWSSLLLSPFAVS